MLATQSVPRSSIPHSAPTFLTGFALVNLKVSTYLCLGEVFSKTGDFWPFDRVTWTEERTTLGMPLNCMASSHTSGYISSSMSWEGHWKLISSGCTFLPHIGNFFNVYFCIVINASSFMRRACRFVYCRLMKSCKCCSSLDDFLFDSSMLALQWAWSFWSNLPNYSFFRSKHLK